MRDPIVIHLIKTLHRLGAARCLSWGIDSYGDLFPSVRCNDIFYWGCSDFEAIDEQDIPLLEKAIEDCLECKSNDGPLLFVARKRGERPQGAIYENLLDPKNYALFDAAGPHRDVDMANPEPHPDDPLDSGSSLESDESNESKDDS